MGTKINKIWMKETICAKNLLKKFFSLIIDGRYVFDRTIAPYKNDFQKTLRPEVISSNSLITRNKIQIY